MSKGGVAFATRTVRSWRKPADRQPYIRAPRAIYFGTPGVEVKLYAFDDLAPNSGCPLSAGLLTGTTIMSQCNGSQFDITDGAVPRGPATLGLATYEVREPHGEIQVRV